MEARKVQRVGPMTLAVSLPKWWVDEVGLSRGDMVFLKPEKNSSLRLMVSTEAESEAESRDCVINADLCSEPRVLERAVVGNYILGRDTILVESRKRLKSVHIEEVRRITSRLMGLGIMEETPNQIVLQCSIDAMKFPIHILIRRLYLIATTMHKEAIQALVDGNPDLAEEAIRRENEADMLYWLIVRLLFFSQRNKIVAEKIGAEGPLQILSSRAIAVLLERIADWAEIIARDVIEALKSQVEIEDYIINALSRISELAYDIYYKAMQCLYSGDVKLANEAIETYTRIVEVEEKELVKKLIDDASTLCPYMRRIVWGVRRIAELGAEICELSINRALERPSKLCKILEA